jgi:CPA1 family monovalent cation:H+ antiporter
MIFGAFISATDPVSVIATFREAKASGRIKLLIESESLFNDGTAAVAFGIAVALLTTAETSVSHIAILFFVTVAGGIVCGVAVAIAIVLLLGKTNDHLVEQTFTMIAAYGSFLLAEHFHSSGVLATLTTGLIVGNVGRLKLISDEGRNAVESLWEFAAFVANSMIFLLVGMRMAHQNLVSVWQVAVIAIAVVLFSRAIAVYSCAAIFYPTRLRLSARHQHILFWGGLRGALALALALSLPDTMTLREEVIRITFAVVAFSICIQGSTIEPLLRRFNAVNTN